MSITAVPLRPVKRRVLIILWAGILLAIAVAAVTAWAGTRDATDEFFAGNKAVPGVVETASGLQYRILTPGEGVGPTDSDVVLVNYTGKLLDGTVFDQSQQPTPFPVRTVVPGFSEGLKLMTKGAKHRMWIKPELGYGSAPQGGGVIPANSVLVFEVELLDFLPETVLQQMQMQQQMQQQGGGAPGGPPQGLPGQPQGVPGQP